MQITVLFIGQVHPTLGLTFFLQLFFRKFLLPHNSGVDSPAETVKFYTKIFRSLIEFLAFVTIGSSANI